MKIKLPFTEQFLWDLYKIFEKVGDIDSTLFARRWDEVANPDLRWLRRSYQKKLGRRRFSQIIYYLKKNGYLREKEVEEGKALLLAPKGEKKILKIKLKLTEKKKRSDGRYIMLFFDIPERKRKGRDHFREELKILGFKFVQQSIWATPYDVLKEVKNLIKRHYFQHYVKILLVKEIEV